MDIKELREAILTEYKTLGETVRQQGEEMKEFGEAREETGTKVSEIDARLHELAQELEEKTQKIETFETELTKMGRPGYDGGLGAEEVKTIGRIVTESEAYQAIEGRSEKSGIPGGKSSRMIVESFHAYPTQERKELRTGNALTNALVEPLRVGGVISAPDQRLFVRDLIPFQSTDRPAVEWVEEIVEAADAGATPPRPANLNTTAAPVAEGALKPEGHLSFVLRNSVAKVIANTLTASRQILSDAPMLRAFINNRLTYSVKLEEESQLIYGDGTGENLQGFLSHPSAGSRLWSAGETGDNMVDAVRRAINDSNIAELPATGIIMHPNQKTDIDILKGDDGHYVWLESQFGGTTGDTRLVRLPLVETTAIANGTAAVGAFALALQGYDVWDAFVEIAEQHSDYRRRNLVLVVGEERLMLANYRPQAIIELTFDSAPV